MKKQLIFLLMIMFQNTHASTLVGDTVSYEFTNGNGTIFNSGTALVDSSLIEFQPFPSVSKFKIDVGANNIDISYFDGLNNLSITFDFLRIYDLDWDVSGSIFLESITVDANGISNINVNNITFNQHEVLIPVKNTFWNNGKISIALQTNTPITTVPLPSGLLLFISGVLMLIGVKRKKF